MISIFRKFDLYSYTEFERLEKLVVGDLRALNFDDSVERDLHLRHFLVAEAEQDAYQTTGHGLVNDQEVVAALEVDTLDGSTRALEQVHVALAIRVAVVQFVSLARLVLRWIPT